MSIEKFDLVIIGAGIHGAGIAQAAAAAGHSVLILEKTAVASGTSSRSSKLIHGGLRYLESGQFRLVRQSLRERELLLKNAPHLVQLKPFYFPLYQHSKRRPWQLRLGLTLYALLGVLRPGSLFREIPVREWDNPDGITHDGLTALFQYWDGTTDDTALTRAVVNSAMKYGAQLRLPARFSYAEQQSNGWYIQYEFQNKTHHCESTVLVNAGGPWVNQILQQIKPSPKILAVDLVQGSHIVVPGTLKTGIYYVEAPRDGRVVFIIPKNQTIMVGTTETAYSGEPEAVKPLEAEIAYLLETLAYYFPRLRHLQRADVIRAFAGLRVLPQDNNKRKKAVFSRTRDTLLLSEPETQPRLISIYGGKLTAYRATAESVLHKIHRTLPKHKQAISTRGIPLTDGDALQNQEISF